MLWVGVVSVLSCDPQYLENSTTLPLHSALEAMIMGDIKECTKYLILFYEKKFHLQAISM